MNERQLSFIEHLEELRRRILYSLGCTATLTIVTFFFSKRVLNFVIRHSNLQTVYFFSPTEAFFARIKIAIFLAIFFSFPFILYQTWAFIGPGLTRTERRVSITYLTSGILLFLIGNMFGYFILIPLGLKFLLSFGNETLQPIMNISRYLNFIFWCLLGSGFLFQLPLLLFFLMKLGIIDIDTVARHRAEAVIIILTICAIITPTGDFFTLSLISIPLLLLFELSIQAARLTGKKKD